MVMQLWTVEDTPAPRNRPIFHSAHMPGRHRSFYGEVQHRLAAYFRLGRCTRRTKSSSQPISASVIYAGSTMALFAKHEYSEPLEFDTALHGYAQLHTQTTVTESR